MDFILSYNNNEMVMPFPVVPNGGISLTRDQDNITFDGVNYELQAIGTMNLASFELSSIFPNRPYPWLRPGSVADGWAYVRTIEAARPAADSLPGHPSGQRWDRTVQSPGDGGLL